MCITVRKIVLITVASLSRAWVLPTWILGSWFRIPLKACAVLFYVGGGLATGRPSSKDFYQMSKKEGFETSPT
jgi:hypothetical protein